MQLHYRGFDITLGVTDQWSARITRSDSGKTWSNGPRSTLDEGHTVCLRRAQNLVDAYRALRG
jgi:hypothetical protein